MRSILSLAILLVLISSCSLHEKRTARSVAQSQTNSPCPSIFLTSIEKSPQFDDLFDGLVINEIRKNEGPIETYISLLRKMKKKVDLHRSADLRKYLDSKLAVSSSSALIGRPRPDGTQKSYHRYYTRVFRQDLLSQAFPALRPNQVDLIMPTTPPASGARVYLLKNNETGEIIGALKFQQEGGLEEILSERAVEKLLKKRNPDSPIVKNLHSGKLSGTDDYFLIQAAAKGRDLNDVLQNGTRREIEEGIESVAKTISKLHGAGATKSGGPKNDQVAPLINSINYELETFNRRLIGDPIKMTGSIAKLAARGKISQESAKKLADFAKKVHANFKNIALSNPLSLRPTVTHGDLHGGNIFLDEQKNVTLIDYGTAIHSLSAKGGTNDKGNDIGRMMGSLIEESLKNGKTGEDTFLDARHFLSSYKQYSKITPGGDEEESLHSSIMFHVLRYFGLLADDTDGVEFRCPKIGPACPSQEKLRQRFFQIWIALSENPDLLFDRPAQVSFSPSSSASFLEKICFSPPTCLIRISLIS